jgi:hypothetical protein
MSEIAKDLNAVHRAFVSQRGSGSTTALFSAQEGFRVVTAKRYEGKQFKNRAFSYDQLDQLHGMQPGPIALDNGAVIDLVNRSSWEIRTLTELNWMKQQHTEELYLAARKNYKERTHLRYAVSILSILSITLSLALIKCLTLI